MNCLNQLGTPFFPPTAAGNLTVVQLWNAFDSEAELFMYVMHAGVSFQAGRRTQRPVVWHVTCGRSHPDPTRSLCLRHSTFAPAARTVLVEPLHPVLPNATENPVHGMLYRQFVSSLTEMSIFLLLSSGSAGIKIGVWISPAGLNNLGRP